MPYDTLRVEHSSAADRVADELRRALFEGEVDAGSPLREMALADAMAVSRSTVREALAVLVAEGLATREPNRGVHVTQLDAVAVEDVCQARFVLESAGIRDWQRASEEARQSVRDALADLADAAATATPAEFTAVHLRFHLSLVALTGSPRLVAQAESLYSEVKLALAQVDRLRRNHGEQVAAHRLLLDLVESGPVEDAVAELDRHIAHGAASMIAAITG